MSMISRYKKKGGFTQLVILMESTPDEKREKLLKMIRDENPNWEREVRAKMLSMAHISTWPNPILMEFLQTCPALVIATAIYPLLQNQRDIFVSVLNPSEKRKVSEFLSEKKPSPGEVFSSQIRIFSEVRQMASLGRIKFEKFDTGLFIDKNIEDVLSGKDLPLFSKPEKVQSVPKEAIRETEPAIDGDETSLLKQKLAQITKENQRLQKENEGLRQKLDSLKDFVRKVA